MNISVVIPLYNKARHIQRAILSVLAQTYQDFELLVVDDGSTDGSGEVVRQMTDPRIRLIAQDNAGVSAARNRGIQEATGEWIAFLDADDEWLPCFLETMMGLRYRHPEAGIYATAYRYTKNDATWRPEFSHCCTTPGGGLLDDYFHAAMGPPPVSATAVMIPKSILAEVGNFPDGIRRGEDLQTWTRIALRYRVAWSSAEGAIYHLSADNRACKPDSVNADFPGAAEIEAAVALGQDSVFSCRMAAEYLVYWRLQIALNCYLNGRRPAALNLLRKTRHTSLFRRKRLFLRIVFNIPPVMLRMAQSLRITLRQRLCRSGRNPA